MPSRKTSNEIGNLSYQELFERMSGTLHEATNLFCSGKDPLEIRDIISKLEDDGDDIGREIDDRLEKYKDPPFRDSVHVATLVNSIDNILDVLKLVANRIVLYELWYTREFLEIGNLLMIASQIIDECMPLMSRPGRNRRNIHAKCNEILVIEDHADDLKDQCIGRIFQQVKDGALSEFVYHHMKELIELLEHGVNQCEDVARLVDGVKRKNS